MNTQMRCLALELGNRVFSEESKLKMVNMGTAVDTRYRYLQDIAFEVSIYGKPSSRMMDPVFTHSGLSVLDGQVDVPWIKFRVKSDVLG